MSPLTAAATYERARRLANLAVWSVDLQCRRLRSTEPEDEVFLFRKWADFGFLVVALTRLRRAASLAAELPEIRLLVQPALRQFDLSVPDLKRMRDVAEHIDDYALDRGRSRSVARNSLEVSSLNDDGPTLEWLEARLNAEEALHAAQRLFRAIQEASSAFQPRT
ncbi:hypothetical protein [Pelomonas sp. KK5]|uniref:hypothetical protein n=1 Tax=Pelomonas sp. KK5 TaxID=1855730 RepID=UPI00117C7471|nr:hypothetical protein [Pelomonas sp. KK5]